VLDNLARAMEYEHTAVTDPAGLVAGLRLTYWQLNDLLEGEGLRPVEAVGRVFDPKIHEAVDIDTSGKSEPGIVTAELQKGWYYENEVLRPARVTVAGAVPRRHSPSERA
ncbi:MAG: nucleotide exchange factor GrpE, partial [Chloroflexota bacterium]